MTPFPANEIEHLVVDFDVEQSSLSSVLDHVLVARIKVVIASADPKITDAIQ